MSLTDRFHNWMRTVAWVSIGVVVVTCAILVLSVRKLSDFPLSSTRGQAGAKSWPKPRSLEEVDWRAFQTRTGSTPAEGSGLASRFRLAGTFFSYGETINDQRKAIIDDIRAGTQRILSEGEEIDAARVVRIFRDRIILREGVNEDQLWLSFSSADQEAAASSVDAASGRTNVVGVGQWADGAAEKYGLKRVGEYRWVFNRERLLDYYRELMDEPERLVNVFDSLKPLYDENAKITGYQLGAEGEADFFRAVGFAENDIVRSVNSIPMTNRRRAEYFIHEFVNNRANAFVLEVERNGRLRKLIYQMR